MSLYVYAIVEGPCELPAEWHGLADAPLSTVSYRSLAAIVSAVDASPPRDTATILRHEQLVEALAVDHRTLPVRFGTVFSDAGVLADALAQRYESLAGDLVRLGGKVELGVIAFWREVPDVPDELVPSVGEGARYLHTRRRAYAGEESAHRLAREVEDAVHDYAIERRLTLLNERRWIVRAAYLVAPADVGRIRARVDDLRRRRSDISIVVSGPWPPYSFVSGTAVEATGAHAS